MEVDDEPIYDVGTGDDDMEDIYGEIMYRKHVAGRRQSKDLPSVRSCARTPPGGWRLSSSFSSGLCLVVPGPQSEAGVLEVRRHPPWVLEVCF